MSTTSEIVFQLNFMAGAADEGFGSKYSDAKIFRAAAARLSELERENARMREALFETHLDLAVYTDIEVARKRLVERRAALAGSGEK